MTRLLPILFLAGLSYAALIYAVLHIGWFSRPVTAADVVVACVIALAAVARRWA